MKFDYNKQKIKDNFVDSNSNKNKIDLLEKEKDNIYNLYKYQEKKIKDKPELFRNPYIEYIGTAPYNGSTDWQSLIFYLPNINDKTILGFRPILILDSIPFTINSYIYYWWDSTNKRLYIDFYLDCSTGSGNTDYKLLLKFESIN